jgi:cytochrome c peroxidase
MTEAKVELGRALFFDKRLSLDRTVSCATNRQPHSPVANYVIQVYEQRKIQKLAGKLVDLCDISKWW